MRKRLLAIVFALVFSVGMSGFCLAAEKCKGKIKAIEEKTLVIDCGGGEEMKVDVENPADYKVDEVVKVKDGKVTKASAKKIEGC